MADAGRVARDQPASMLARETVAHAALDLLDEGGLANCMLPALAARLGTTQDALKAQIGSRKDMLAMLGSFLAETATDPLAVDLDGGSWRDILRQRALNLRHAMLSRRDGAELFAQLADPLPVAGVDGVAALGEAGFSTGEARAAVQLIDRFALGWALIEQGREASAPEDDHRPSYADQIDTLLAGVAATRNWGGKTTRNSRFQSHLWVFLRNARDSANIAFARTEHIVELDRRILLLLLAQGDLTLATISVSNGVDKAQVSRAIKRLHQNGFVLRSGIRSPLKLSESGRQLAERLVRLAELRNRELTFGIEDDQLGDLFGVLDLLLGRAIALYEQERKLSAAHGKEADLEFPDHAPYGATDREQIPIDRSRILPPFITLCSYMMRAGSLSFKRTTGLSNFDTWVLVEVCKNPPISWPQLVLALYRDQSQAGRTVNRLIDLDLLERDGKPGRRHGYFAPTKEGARIAGIINGLAAKRSEFLFQGIDPPRLNNFMAAFEVLARNAEVQLAREKAIEEMDRDVD